MSMLFDYHYSLPPELIALEPVFPRDSAKLMVYETKTDEVKIDIFAHLGHYLPKDSALVLNETKVMPARLQLRKQRGRPADILFLFNEPQVLPGLFKVISSRYLPVGQTLKFDDDHLFTIVRQEERFFYLKPHFSEKEFFRILEEHGRMPLPHYLQSTSLDEKKLRERYQTVFAAQPGSVAAPTASLHFTPDLLKRIEQHHEVLKLTHHVGLATFTPVLPENLEQGKLLEEWYEIGEGNAKIFNDQLSIFNAGRMQNAKLKMKNPTQKLVAVGTTAVRALESFARSGEWMGKTDLFIFPPYNFQMVDVLVTNFHLPKTSLMMLVQAFLEHKGAKRNLMELYELAISEKFRFYSFGDSMLIL